MTYYYALKLLIKKKLLPARSDFKFIYDSYSPGSVKDTLKILYNYEIVNLLLMMSVFFNILSLFKMVFITNLIIVIKHILISNLHYKYAGVHILISLCIWFMIMKVIQEK